MTQKIFIPYFISNSTIMEFEKQKANSKLSLMDIMNTFFNSKKLTSKFYFKVLDMEENEIESDFNLSFDDSEDYEMKKELRSKKNLEKKAGKID